MCDLVDCIESRKEPVFGYPLMNYEVETRESIEDIPLPKANTKTNKSKKKTKTKTFNNTNYEEVP